MLEPGALVDSKDGARYPVGSEVLVYDAQAGRLLRMHAGELPRFIAGLEVPTRHWIQLAQLPWVRDLILRWMPQLGYLWR